MKNLKTIKNHQLGLLFALESNQVQQLNIPEEGLVVWLHDFGSVKLFRTWLKDQPRHYGVSLPDAEQLARFDRSAFAEQHEELSCYPEVFTFSSKTYAYIDPKGDWLIVRWASAKKTKICCAVYVNAWVHYRLFRSIPLKNRSKS